MNKQDRKSRIIARGENSNHCHVITGDAIVRNENGEVIIELGNEDAILRHLLEDQWLGGKEVWTEEHGDINLTEIDKQTTIGECPVRQGDVALEKIADRTYKYIPQMEYDPYEDLIRQVKD